MPIYDEFPQPDPPPPPGPPLPSNEVNEVGARVREREAIANRLAAYAVRVNSGREFWNSVNEAKLAKTILSLDDLVDLTEDEWKEVLRETRYASRQSILVQVSLLQKKQNTSKQWDGRQQGSAQPVDEKYFANVTWYPGEDAQPTSKPSPWFASQKELWDWVHLTVDGLGQVRGLQIDAMKVDGRNQRTLIEEPPASPETARYWINKIREDYLDPSKPRVIRTSRGDFPISGGKIIQTVDDLLAGVEDPGPTHGPESGDDPFGRVVPMEPEDSGLPSKLIRDDKPIRRDIDE